MNKLKNFLIVFLIISEFQYSKCYKWISLKSGDKLPENAVSIAGSDSKYVGRTKYLNTMQLAEISTGSYRDSVEHATLILYSSKIVRHQFEVLVATGKCEWIFFDKNHIPENIVRGGTSWNLEPVFVGRELGSIVSIFVTLNKKQSFPQYPYPVSNSPFYNLEVLICDSNHKWIDATSSSVPENSIRIGNDDGYVARLLGPNLHVPGIVYPKSNQTSIWYKNNKLESFNIEVLVGEPKQYKWKNMKPKTGIPENAVVCGVSDNQELTYIAKTCDIYGEIKVFPITFSETNYIDGIFKILVDTINT
ncbi:uncharacterized protein LOC129911774 [Episyrphus balteatus]|uniref:uncharacterized protein LOC129911774 n=1 Tax=Episyrphus balteatus TaxID=286459 RepID=UPI0024862449|nr:uncharacterized protein LOC129911774 [Episyrphus balteatus]